jgi:hypothetical protein
MTPLIAARSQWVRSFSRRLFTVVDVAPVPGAWAQVCQDPFVRLESQLARVAAGPHAAGAAPADTPGFVENPGGRAVPLSRPGDWGRDSAAGTASRPGSTRGDGQQVSTYVAPAANPFIIQTRRDRAVTPEEHARSLHGPPAAASLNPQVRKAPIDDLFADRRSGPGSGDEAEITAQRIVPRGGVTGGSGLAEKPFTERSRDDRVGNDPARRVAVVVQNISRAPSTPASAPESSPDAVLEPTRLVRGASGLAGLLRANTQEATVPGNHRQPSGLTPAPAAPAPAEFTGGVQRKAVTAPAGSEEPSRVPAATPPTIDDVLAELHERLHLEYLRTYGASGE